MAESAVALSEVVNGRRFGRLTAVAFAGSLQGYGRGVRRWEFRCDCGNPVVVSLFKVRRGHVRSCGCAEAEQDKLFRKPPARLNGFTAQHDRYETAAVVARIGLVETEFTTAVVNRAVSVIDGWIDEGIFERRHIRVIEHARDLWRDLGRPTHDFFDSDDPEDRKDSWDAERARNLLRRARTLVYLDDWRVFENVVRWNEPVGLPGSKLTQPSERSVAAAQAIVIGVAETVSRALFL